MNRAEFDLHIAKLVLEEIAEYGFVLSGGQAAIISGLVNRTTKDVDLFSNQYSAGVLPEASVRAVNVLRSQGYVVDEDMSVSNPNFFRAYIRDQAGNVCQLELGYDYRAFAPVDTAVGPVVDVRDFAAAKMNAFVSRLELRDSLDIFGLMERGGFTREALVVLAVDFDEGFQLTYLAARLRFENRRALNEFEEYGVHEVRAGHIVKILSLWADDIERRLQPEPQQRLSPESSFFKPPFSYPPRPHIPEKNSGHSPGM